MDADSFMKAAIDEARQGLAEGGIPIGSVLVKDGKLSGADTINVFKKRSDDTLKLTA